MYQYTAYVTLSRWELPATNSIQSQDSTRCRPGKGDGATGSVSATVLIAGPRPGDSRAEPPDHGPGHAQAGDVGARPRGTRACGEWGTKWEETLAALVRRDERLARKAWLYCTLVRWLACLLHSSVLELTRLCPVLYLMCRDCRTFNFKLPT